MDWAMIVSATAAISGIVLGWFGRERSIKQDTAAESERDGQLKSDMEYIKRGVDDVRIEQRTQGQRFEALSERVTRVEESTKQSHKRIDRIERRTS